LGQRQPALKVFRKLVRDHLPGDLHRLRELYLSMSAIDGEFLVDLDKTSCLIVHLLPETKRNLVAIDFLQVPGGPSVVSGNIQPVDSPAVRGRNANFGNLRSFCSRVAIAVTARRPED
jgi:hypothetical protein